MSGPHLPTTWSDAPVADAAVGGCRLSALVAEHGSPLQVLDAADLDARAADYVAALGVIDRPARAVFATK
jgi:diaminopimelate decarboxylase